MNFKISKREADDILRELKDKSNPDRLSQKALGVYNSIQEIEKENARLREENEKLKAKYEKSLDNLISYSNLRQMIKDKLVEEIKKSNIDDKKSLDKIVLLKTLLNEEDKKYDNL